MEMRLQKPPPLYSQKGEGKERLSCKSLVYSSYIKAFTIPTQASFVVLGVHKVLQLYFFLLPRKGKGKGKKKMRGA